MRRRQLLATLSAAGTAGCLRLASNDDSSPTPGGPGDASGPESPSGPTAEQTSDPADDTPSPPADTATETPPPDLSYPAGLSDDGVNPVLADAHLNELVGRSFALDFADVDVTRGRIATQRDHRVDDGTAIAEWSHQGPITLYAAAGGSFWREDLGDVVTYGQDRNPFDLGHIVLNRRLRQVIRAGVWERPTVTAGDDGPVFRIRADGVDDPGGLEEEFEASSLETFAADGRVTENGVIRELVAEFEVRDRTEDDRLIAWRFTYELGSLDEVSVSEPGWFETAQSEAPDVSAAITDDGQFVEMTHAGGNPILPGTDVVLYDRENTRNWGYRENRDPFEAGTTVYLWMEDDQLRWERGSRPTDASPQPLDRSLAFWAHRGGAEYFGAIELN